MRQLSLPASFPVALTVANHAPLVSLGPRVAALLRSKPEALAAARAGSAGSAASSARGGEGAEEGARYGHVTPAPSRGRPAPKAPAAATPTATALAAAHAPAARALATTSPAAKAASKAPAQTAPAPAPSGMPSSSASTASAAAKAKAAAVNATEVVKATKAVEAEAAEEDAEADAEAAEADAEAVAVETDDEDGGSKANSGGTKGQSCRGRRGVAVGGLSFLGRKAVPTVSPPSAKVGAPMVRARRGEEGGWASQSLSCPLNPLNPITRLAVGGKLRVFQRRGVSPSPCPYP